MGYSDGSDFSGTYYNSSSRPANSLVSYMESHDEERMGYKQSQWGNGILKTDINARMSQLATNADSSLPCRDPRWWQFGEMGYDIPSMRTGARQETDYGTTWKSLSAKNCTRHTS